MSGDRRVKSFIDRVLRLKEEQDALAADIREVYAEAKSEGFDKTAMGEVVAHLRRIEKKGRDAVDERGAMFDLYLTAYEGVSHTHAPAYTRETADAVSDAGPAEGQSAVPPLDTQAEEVLMQEPHVEAEGQGGVMHEHGRGEGSQPRLPSDPAENKPSATAVIAGAPHPHPAQAPSSRPQAGQPDDAVAPSPASSGDLTPSVPESPPAADLTGEAEVRTTETSPVSIIPEPFEPPAFLRKSVPADYRPHCLNPDNCGSSTIDKHCYTCRVAMEAARESEVA